MRYLYQKNHTFSEANRFENDFLRACAVEVARPTPMRLARKAERLSLRDRLGRLYFWAITFGKYRIYYLLDGDRVVHTSYVVPKCSKFPFMEKNDLEIGPCFTNEEYRRRGSYAYMLERITTDPEFENRRFYMIVKDANLPSVKGIEKSGFKRCAAIVRTKLLKRYVATEQEAEH